MAWLRIPPQYVRGLANLLAFDDRHTEELASILEQVPPTLDSDDFLNVATSKFGDGQSVPTEIITALLSLNAVRLRLDLDIPKLVVLVCEAMNEGEHESLRIPQEHRDVFPRHLIRLLNIESLLYPTKAPAVVLAHEHVFTYARTITDVRPVFGPDVTAQPPAAAIIHTLQLTCRHGDNVENFYVAMDATDLDLLRNVLKRAVLKAENLRSMLIKVGMTIIGE
jgi:hypothetical protein